MAAAVSLPLRAHASTDRFWLLDFLRSELAPFPGRAAGTLRVVIACTGVLVLCMTLRVPEAYLAVWVVTRVAMEESSASLLTGLVFVVALTVGLAFALVLLIVAMDQPALRFCLIGLMAALGLFLRQTFVVGALGFVVGLIGTVIMTVPDFLPNPELAVRGCLWLWPVFALGIAAAVAANLLIAPSDPAALLREELTARVTATEEALRRRANGMTGRTDTAQLARAGVSRLLLLLKSAEVARRVPKAHHQRQSALITATDRLVSTAAALERLPRVATDDERRRLARLADRCAEVRQALTTGIMRTSVMRTRFAGSDGPAHGDGASPAYPALTEIAHGLDLIGQAFHEGSGDASHVASSAGRLFVRDAFTNPEYVRYALKGALAVLICYVLQCAVDWPGIRTCIITCLIVALGSEGATIQKATLRISGAFVGATLGFLAIFFLVPSMESITALVLVVAAGTAVAAWVVLGSPRIAYAGVQLAFAFLVCVIQGFEPSWHFDTIRDRLIGILLGNAVITLVFSSVWPLAASDAMWTKLGSALRAMAQLATVRDRDDDAVYRATVIDDLRAQADRDFTTAQQLADQAGFELSEAQESRARLQTAVADAQSVLLTQLAIVAEPAPDARSFDRAVADHLSAIARDAENRGRRAGPVAGGLVAPIALPPSNDDAALYRELVPRIERLASDVAR